MVSWCGPKKAQRKHKKTEEGFGCRDLDSDLRVHFPIKATERNSRTPALTMKMQPTTMMMMIRPIHCSVLFFLLAVFAVTEAADISMQSLIAGISQNRHKMRSRSILPNTSDGTQSTDPSHRLLPLIEGECDEAYNVIGISDDCVVNSGECPDACHDHIADADATCRGEVLTNNNGVQVPYALIDMLPTAVAIGKACVEAPVQFMLENGDDLTCQEWLLVNQLIPFLFCSVTCTATCKDVIDRVYAACNPTDMFTGSDEVTMSAQEMEEATTPYRHQDCNAHADTLIFLGGHGPTAPCNVTLNTTLFDKSCTPTDDIFQISTSSFDACPSSCHELLLNIHETCDGKIIQLPSDQVNDGNDDGHEQKQVLYSPSLLATQFLSFHEACRDAPFIFLTSAGDRPSSVANDLSCNEWLVVNSITAYNFCKDECTDLCHEVIDWTYSKCRSTDTVQLTVGAENGNSMTLTAEEVEDQVSLVRHADCNAYADTLSFATNAPTPTPIVEIVSPTEAPVDELSSSAASVVASSFVGWLFGRWHIIFTISTSIVVWVVWSS